MKIDPRKIVLQLMPRKCDVCEQVQHVFFLTTQEYDEWDCPVCREIPEGIDHEENFQTQRACADRYEENQEGVSVPTESPSIDERI
jgi:hypothetical protein